LIQRTIGDKFSDNKMMLVSTQISQEEALMDSVCGELKDIFMNMNAFEEEVRLTRKKFISKISDCLEKHSITEIPTDSPLYYKVFLLYVQYFRSHIPFKSLINRERFHSMIDMELQFNQMTLERTSLTLLCRSKSSK
jgi:hypothetical protein